MTLRDRDMAIIRGKVPLSIHSQNDKSFDRGYHVKRQFSHVNQHHNKNINVLHGPDYIQPK